MPFNGLRSPQALLRVDCTPLPGGSGLMATIGAHSLECVFPSGSGSDIGADCDAKISEFLLAIHRFGPILG
jgi:hypothetical protein